jgi:Tfp pilus assembly protein PilO
VLTDIDKANEKIRQTVEKQEAEVVELNKIKLNYEQFITAINQTVDQTSELESLLPNEEALAQVQSWAAKASNDRGTKLIYFNRTGSLTSTGSIIGVPLQIEVEGPEQNIRSLLNEFSRYQRALEIKSIKIIQAPPPVVPSVTTTPTTANAVKDSYQKATAKIDFMAYMKNNRPAKTAVATSNQ